ncbi:MAG: hypothetical protein GY951_00505 [Psychromonas sp.]|nr:hypothetical protein [Alteromonadales bacterium]MCP5076530.1 hypothetical protein [Psychromonas sp.]
MSSRHELQEVVALLSKLITQVALVLTSKSDHILNSFGITKLLSPTAFGKRIKIY